MNLIKKLKESHIFKSVSYILCGNVVSQIESFAFVILATRLLGVEEYGVYAVIMMVLSTVVELSDLGMNSAVIRFTAEYSSREKEELEKQVIALAFKRKMKSALIVTIVMILFSKNISTIFLKTDYYANIFIIVAISIGLALINSLNNSILQGKRWYKKFFYSMTITNVVLFVLLILLVVLNKFTVYWIIIVNVINYGVSAIASYYLVGYDLKEIYSTKKYDKNVLAKFNSFGGWMLLWSLLFILQSKIDILMLSTLTTVVQVSYYDVATKLSKPFFMIFNSYGQVLNPLLATMKTKKELHEITKKTIKFLSVVTVLLVIAMVLSRPAILILFEEKYIDSILPLQIVLFSLIIYIWSMPFNSVLYTLNKPYIFTLSAAIGLVVTVVGNVLLLGKYGAVGAAITYMLAQIVSLVLNYGGYKYYINKIDLEE